MADRANTLVKGARALSEESTFLTAAPGAATAWAVTDARYLNWAQTRSSVYFAQDATDEAVDISQLARKACLERLRAEQHPKAGLRGQSDSGFWRLVLHQGVVSIKSHMHSLAQGLKIPARMSINRLTIADLCVGLMSCLTF